jgi:ABC-type branched-subunit amino acid transport system ATPase component
MTLLAANGIVKRFSGIRAVDDVSLTVDDGEFVGLIGPNGAGKTTLFNCLLGATKADSGNVRFLGKDVTSTPLHRRAHMGLGRTFQRVELFPGMTVLEHVLVAERARRGGGALWKDVIGLGRTTADEHERAERVLALVGLAAMADRPIDSLGLGRTRLVEVARALVLEPKLLLLDEPSSGLDRAETESLAECLRRVHAETGLALLLVEHDIAMVRALAQRLYVMDLGRLIAEGPTNDVLASPEVRHAYVGDTPAAAESAPFTVATATTNVRPALELSHVDAGYGSFRAIFDVSLSVRAGGVLALVGPNGAGKTTVARVCCGLVRPTAGDVVVAGVTASTWRPYRFARAGVASLPEGRSIFGSLTVDENLTMALRHRTDARAAALARAYELFPRLAERRAQSAGTLSGGEQRMLALAPVLAAPPRIVIADELSLGLAPKIVDEVYDALARVRNAGTTLVIVEQQVSHALALADEVVVLDKGAVSFAGPADDPAAVAAAGDAL